MLESVDSKLTPEKEEINRYFEIIKSDIMADFEIKNLSNLELFSLRKIVEDTLLKYREQKEKREKGQSAESDFGLEQEIIARFIYENYGVHESDLPTVNVIRRADNSEILKVFYDEKDEDINGYANRLREQGIEHTYFPEYSDLAKDFIRKKREESHLI